MRKLVLLLTLVVLLSGCVGQGPPKGNGVAIQSFSFDVKEIEPDIPVTLGLSVKNFGGKQATEIFAELQGPPEWMIEIKGKTDTLPARQNINNLRPPDPERDITEGEEDYIEWIMKAPKKGTKITYPFQAIVYYKYVTESESLVRVVTNNYYREKRERGGLITSKTSSGPLNVIVNVPSTILSGDSPVDIPVQVEIQNIGGGRAYKYEKDFKYPKEETKDVVEVNVVNLKCDEKEVKLIDGVGRMNCKFTSKEKINNFQDFPISIKIDYRYYTTALSSITVLPFEIKDKTKFKNDIITLEDYEATREANPKDTGRIEFFVKNNGDRTVENIEVYFFDIPGIKTYNLRCEGITPTDSTKCVFKNLKSLDGRKVVLTYTVPDNSATISFSVNYVYSGSRIFAIPVINDFVLKEPPIKYYKSEPTYGPILVDFEGDVGKTIQKDSQTIKEYWGRKGENSKIEMKFTHIGSGTKTGIISEDFILPKGSVKLKLIGSEPVKTNCDFNDQLISTKDIKPKSSSENELKCYFKTDFDESWKIVNAEVNFDYTYQFTRHQEITVKKA